MSEIKVGDVIQVKRVMQFGGELRTNARVIHVTDSAIGVELLHGAHFEDGSDRIWLQKQARHRTWE